MSYEASYLKLLENGDLLRKVEAAREHINACRLCPHECDVDREKELGVCGAGSQAIVASYGPHRGEESVLVGSRGSGTIFFSYCNMSCVYCQNYDISQQGRGQLVTDERLAEIMLDLQENYGCHNINLVTPTHYIANILQAIYLAAKKGLKIPIVYNTGGYESLESLKLLEGVIDIYMPDFKYSSDKSGRKYSKVGNYPKYAKKALKEMDRQVGGLKVDSRGLAYRGLMIRHLILPGGLEETKEVLDFIHEELSPDVFVNLMDQYTPSYKAFEYKEISRRISPREYRQGYEHSRELGLRLDRVYKEK